MKEKDFLLPEKIEDGRLDAIIALFSEVRSNQKIRYSLNFENTKTITSAGHALLMCLSDSIREHGVASKAHSFDQNLISSHVFLRKILTHSNSQTFEKIDQMKVESEYMIVMGVEDSLSPFFLDEIDRKFETHINETNRWYIRFILNELMQNAKDHSTSERFYLYCSLEKDHIQFGVCDMGVSIPAKLEQKYQCQNDVEYLKKSLELRVGTRRTRSGGLGLNHMFEILKKQKGRLVIISRNAQLRIYFKRSQTQTSTLKRRLFGTWCMARINL